uniref:Uncharacterized protein n=1 Tax=Aegilops tauschii subsp. strangulata TaxID=200361 RepID=A0A453NYT8_AEGTS
MITARFKSSRELVCTCLCISKVWIIMLHDVIQEAEELVNLAPDKMLLKWMNFHIKKAGYKKTVTNFSTDVKVCISIVFNYSWILHLLEDKTDLKNAQPLCNFFIATVNTLTFFAGINTMTFMACLCSPVKSFYDIDGYFINANTKDFIMLLYDVFAGW